MRSVPYVATLAFGIFLAGCTNLVSPPFAGTAIAPGFDTVVSALSASASKAGYVPVRSDPGSKTISFTHPSKLGSSGQAAFSVQDVSAGSSLSLIISGCQKNFLRDDAERIVADALLDGRLPPPSTVYRQEASAACFSIK